MRMIWNLMELLQLFRKLIWKARSGPDIWVILIQIPEWIATTIFISFRHEMEMWLCRPHSMMIYMVRYIFILKMAPKLGILRYPEPPERIRPIARRQIL